MASEDTTGELYSSLIRGNFQQEGKQPSTPPEPAAAEAAAHLTCPPSTGRIPLEWQQQRYKDLEQLTATFSELKSASRSRPNSRAGSPFIRAARASAAAGDASESGSDDSDASECVLGRRRSSSRRRGARSRSRSWGASPRGFRQPKWEEGEQLGAGGALGRGREGLGRREGGQLDKGYRAEGGAAPAEAGSSRGAHTDDRGGGFHPYGDENDAGAAGVGEHHKGQRQRGVDKLAAGAAAAAGKAGILSTASAQAQDVGREGIGSLQMQQQQQWQRQGIIRGEAADGAGASSHQEEPPVSPAAAAIDTGTAWQGFGADWDGGLKLAGEHGSPGYVPGIHATTTEQLASLTLSPDPSTPSTSGATGHLVYGSAAGNGVGGYVGRGMLPIMTPGTKSLISSISGVFDAGRETTARPKSSIRRPQAHTNLDRLKQVAQAKLQQPAPLPGSALTAAAAGVVAAGVDGGGTVDRLHRHPHQQQQSAVLVGGAMGGRHQQVEPFGDLPLGRVGAAAAAAGHRPAGDAGVGACQGHVGGGVVSRRPAAAGGSGASAVSAAAAAGGGSSGPVVVSVEEYGSLPLWCSRQVPLEELNQVLQQLHGLLVTR